MAYQAKGDNNRAVTDFTKAIEIDPRQVETYKNRGNAFEAKGDHDQAITDLSKAIEIKPDDADTYNNSRRSLYG